MAELEFNIKANFDEITKARQEMGRLREELRKTTKATDPVVVQDLTDRYADQKRKVSELSSAMSRYATVMSSDYGKKMQNLTREVYNFELQADASRRNIEKLSSEIAKMQSKLRKGGLDIGTETVLKRDIGEKSTILKDERGRLNNITGLGKQARTELQNMQAEYVRYSGVSNAAADNVKMMTDALSGMIGEMQKVPTVGEGASSLLNRIGGDAKSLAVSLMGGLGFEQLAEHIFNVRSQFQQLEISFSTMLGSEQKAGALMNQLIATAAKTPFNMSSITQGAKQLLAYGTAASEVNDILVHLGDISAGLSVPLGDLVYLYGTTMAQGRMYTMDLRQFMGRGIPMAEELGKIMGKTTEEVQQAVTDGKVGAELVKKAIINMSSEGGKFGGLMDKQATTLQGKWSNIEDSVDQMFNAMGKKSEGIFGWGLDRISDLVDNWANVVKIIGAAAVAVGTYKAGLMAAASIQRAQNEATLNNITSSLDAQLKAYQEQTAQYRAVSGKDTDGYRRGRLQDLNRTLANTDMIGNRQAEELVSLKIKEAEADGIITKQMAEQLQLKRNLLVAQSQSTAKDQMEAEALSKGLDEKMEQFKTMEGDYRHLNGKDTKEYRASRYNELGAALTDTENIGDEFTEQNVSRQIELAKTEGLISEEMAKQLQLKRDLLVEQTKLAEKEQAEWQNTVNAKEQAENELREKQSQQEDIARLNAEAALRDKISKANDTDYGKALLKTHELERQTEQQQELYDKSLDEANAKKEVLVKLDEQIAKQKELLEQKEKAIVNDNGAVDMTSFGGYEEGFSDNEGSAMAIYDEESAKLESLMKKRSQAYEEFKTANENRKAIMVDLEDVTDRLAEAQESEVEAYKDAGAAADDIADTVQLGLDIQESKTTITEAATAVTQTNTVAEEANAVSKNANTGASGRQTIAEGANTATESSNTVAKNINTATENANTTAKKGNTLSTAMHTAGTKIATAAEEAFSYTINAVTASLKGMWAAMVANPLTGIITLVTTAISVFSMLGNSEDELAAKTENMTNKAEEASERVRILFSVLGSGNDAEKQKDTIGALKAAFEEYGVQLDENKMKSKSLAEQTQELIDKKEELLGVIEEQTIAMAHQNEVQAAYDEYNNSKEEAKKNFMDKTENVLTAGQASMAASLIKQEDMDLMNQYLEELKGLKAGTTEYIATQKNLQAVRSEVLATLEEYYTNLGLTKEQMRDVRYATAVLVDKYSAANNVLKEKIETDDKARAAAEKASGATRNLTEKEILLAAKTTAVKKTFKELNSDIQQTILLCSKKLCLDIKVNYDDSQLPEWIRKMSDAQLKASMSVRKEWLNRHKDGDVMVIGGQKKTYTQVSNELGMMSAASSNRANKHEKTEKEKKEEEKARKKAEREAEREANERATREGNRRKAEVDYAHAISIYSGKAEETIDKNRITVMQEGLGKELAQIQDNYEKEKKAIEDGIDKLVEARKKRDRTIWVNQQKGRKNSMWKQEKSDKEYRKEVLGEALKDAHGDIVQGEDGKPLTVGSSTEKLLNDALAKANKKREKLLRDGLIPMYSYLKEYGSIQQQKVAITEEYNEKIREAREKGKEYEAASLEEKRKQELETLKFTELKNSIDWEAVFNDISSQSTSALRELKVKLKVALNTEDISVKDAKVLAEKIREIEDKINERTDFFAQILPGLKERKRLTSEAAEVQREYNKAISEEIDMRLRLSEAAKAVQNTARGKTGKEFSVAELAKMSKDDYMSILNLDPLTEAGKAAADEFDRLVIASANLGKAQEKLTSTQTRVANFNQAVKDGKSVKDVVETLFNLDMTFTEGLETIDQNLQSMVELVNNVGLGNTSFGRAVSSFKDGVQGFNGAIRSLFKADIVGFFGGFVNGFKGFGKLFGIGGGNEKEVNKKIERLTKANEILTDALDRLREEIQNISGEKAIAKTNDAITYQKEKNDNLQQIMLARLGYSSAHHSFNYYWSNDRVSREKREKLSKDMGRKEGDVWTGDLHDIRSAEEAAALLKDPEIVQLIRSTGKGGYGEAVYQCLKDWAEEAGQIEELQKALYESLTQTSFDSMRSSFINTLMDMNASAKDFSNDFSKMLMQSVLTAKVDDVLSDKLKDFYDKWGKMAEANGGKLSTEQIAELNKEYEQIVQEGMKIRDEAAAVTGYKNSYQQNASSGTFETMSQETGDELNGRFTAVQIATEGTFQVTQEIDRKLGIMLGVSEADYLGNEDVNNLPMASTGNVSDDSVLFAKIAELNANNGQISTALDEGRTILAQSLMYLQSIDERQEKWHKPMMVAFNKIGRIADKVERL